MMTACDEIEDRSVLKLENGLRAGSVAACDQVVATVRVIQCVEAAGTYCTICGGATVGFSVGRTDARRFSQRFRIGNNAAARDTAITTDIISRCFLSN
jgi:hypothetical protein